MTDDSRDGHQGGQQQPRHQQHRQPCAITASGPGDECQAVPHARACLELAPVTQAWLAAGEDPVASVTGKYLFHQREQAANPAANSRQVQDDLLAACAELTGVQMP